MPPINGPKYFPSFVSFRVIEKRGNFSFVCALIYGYVLSSFKRMLYFGLYFLMRLFSSASASISVAVIMYEKSTILATIAATFSGL